MIEKIKKLASDLENKTINYRQDLHRFPEPRWREFRTASIAIKKMQELDYTITMGSDALSKEYMMSVPDETTLKNAQINAINHGADKELVDKMTGGFTAFWADMKFSDDNIFLALRFDMDSNIVTESSDEAHIPFKEGYSSCNKNAMHACGHDGHVSIGLTVAEIIANIKDNLKGSIRFIFQPAEEGSCGALPMVYAGACNNITHILGLHIGFQAENSNTLVCGTDGFLASTKLNVSFTGKPSHAGAYPEDGNNALLAACNACLNMYAISRNSKGPTRINVGVLNSGDARNIIPANAHLELETRGLTTELNEYMENHVKRIVEASALMHDCTFNIEKHGSSMSGFSNKEMIDIIKESVKYIDEYTNIIENKSFGAGEDFTCMLYAVQQNGGIGSYIQAGIDRYAPHHNDKFNFNNESLRPAVLACAITAYNILKK